VRLHRNGDVTRIGERVLYAVRRSDGLTRLTRTERLRPPT
jgi:hypothetical protein